MTIDKSSDFYDIGHEIYTVITSFPLLITSLLIIISSIVWNLSGLVVTRKVNASYRVVNEILMVIIVWIYQLFAEDL